MQSSVRSETPRFATLPGGSVYVNSEVSVVSSPSPAPTNKTQMPSIANGHNRTQSKASIRSTTPQPSQWGSRSKASDGSSRVARPSQHYRSSIQDSDFLDNDRESIKPLAEFLMTREPPSSNWMSIPEDDKSLKALKRRSSFSIFGWNKSKKEKQKKLLQLPDSAVAATTRRGARHIAISIPLQHGPGDIKRQHSAYPASSPSKYSSERPDRAAVTILSSVTELRESSSGTRDSVPNSRNGAAVGGMHHLGEFPDLRGIKALEEYYAHPKDHQQRFRPGTALTGPDPLRSHKSSYVAVSPIATSRQDPRQYDPRRSDGMIGNPIPVGTIAGHARGQSDSAIGNGTTQLSSLKLDPPPRNSSIPKSPKSVGEQPTQTQKNSQRSRPEQSVHAARNETLVSQTTTPSPPTVLGTAIAAPARGYNTGTIGSSQIVRSTTPKSQGACSPPTTKLPDLPVNVASISHPGTAPPVQSKSTTSTSARRSSALRDGLDENNLQVRQARVKARKHRDMEDVRSRSSSRHRQPLPESLVPNVPAITTTSPPRDRKGKGRSASPRNRGGNSITPIMLVVNLPPYTGDSPKLKAEERNRYTVSTRTHTPPYSISSSDISDDDNRDGFGKGEWRKGSTMEIRSNMIATRRQERRLKRNTGLREKELDERLRKIESDNRMLLDTINLAAGFWELNKRASDSGRDQVVGGGEGGDRRDGLREGKPRLRDRGDGRDSGIWGDGEREQGSRLGDLEIMDSIMRDLHGNAGRVSMEGIRGGWEREVDLEVEEAMDVVDMERILL